MAAPPRTVTARDLVAAYLESLRPQVHPIMTEHVQKTLEAFEAAFKVKIPRDVDEVPGKAQPLFYLFRSTTDAFLALRTPLGNFLEAGLIFRRLEESGADGNAILESINDASAKAKGLQETEIDILERLLVI